jgi:hypothetical protein
MKALFEPRIFNILIMSLSGAASLRWAIARDWPQAGYWGSALLLNLFVTMMAAK